MRCEVAAYIELGASSLLANLVNEDRNTPIATPSPNWRFVGWLILALLVATAFAGYWHYARRPQAFIHHWSERFRTIDSLDAARQLARSESRVVLRVLPSGEWFVTTCEHSCCSGAGFDSTIIRDSTGAIYADTTHTFCGVEGLGEALGERRVPAASLSAFYSALSHLQLEKQ
jgi:hypothetical protein